MFMGPSGFCILGEYFCRILCFLGVTVLILVDNVVFAFSLLLSYGTILLRKSLAFVVYLNQASFFFWMFSTLVLV